MQPKKELPKEHKDKMLLIKKDTEKIIHNISLLSPSNNKVIGKKDREKICKNLIENHIIPYENAIYNLYIEANKLEEYFVVPEELKEMISEEDILSCRWDKSETENVYTKEEFPCKFKLISDSINNRVSIFKEAGLLFEGHIKDREELSKKMIELKMLPNLKEVSGAFEKLFRKQGNICEVPRKEPKTEDGL